MNLFSPPNCDYLSQVCVVVLSVVMKHWNVFAVQSANSMPQSESIPPRWRRMAESFPSQIIHSLQTLSLQLPGPPAADDPRCHPHVLLHPLLSSSCISLSLLSLSEISYLHLFPLLQQLPKPYFYLSVGGWSEPHPCRCSALRDSLTAHRGRQDRALEGKKMREKGQLNEQERFKERRKVGGSMVG